MMSGEVVRRIVTKVTDEQLQKDLEKYRERAIELWKIVIRCYHPT